MSYVLTRTAIIMGLGRQRLYMRNAVLDWKPGLDRARKFESYDDAWAYIPFVPGYRADDGPVIVLSIDEALVASILES